MSRLASIRKDLAALGAMAPLRAVYEVGKRTGAHGLALRSLAGTAKPASLRVVAQFRPAVPVPGPAVERCLEDARRILHEGHLAFGIRVPVNGPNDWNSLGDTRKSWPAEPFWWQIDIRTDKRLGDVKWSWELGRHRDLVVLARAAYLDPDGPWLDGLTQRLRWWFTATPAERGIHWYSNLEIALRAIAWIQIYALCSTKLPSDILEEMALHIGQARRHLLVDFPYTASSMRNNHLLGDALGLLAISTFTGAKPESVLSWIAEKSFSGQIERHMRTDGSMIEDSLSYHRFVMEMLAIKVKLGDRSNSTVRALLESALHLQRMGVLDGAVPQWGDWDEGRVLASSGSKLDLAGSTALSLLLTKSASDAQWWSDFDEVAWYADAPTAAAVLPARALATAMSPISSSGGITRVTAGDWNVWLKYGTGPSHQHADLTHVSARHGDTWVLVDPGTGTYNGELDIRNAFRTSRAHNGVRIGGEEMFVPHRAFRWLTSAKTAPGAPLITDGAIVVWSVHDAYSRLEFGGRVARAVVVTASGLTAIDWREGGHEARLTIALAPGAKVVSDRLMVDSEELQLTGLASAAQSKAAASPFGGFHSTTYGRWEPALWLEERISGASPTTWGVHEIGSVEHEASINGEAVTVAGVELHLTFYLGGATLRATLSGKTHHLIAGKERT
jgi:hypothetical protein